MSTTLPTIDQCLADPELAQAVRDLAAALERENLIRNNSQRNNEVWLEQAEEALAVALAARGPSRLPFRADARYRACDAGVRALEGRLDLLRSVVLAQRGTGDDHPDQAG